MIENLYHLCWSLLIVFSFPSLRRLYQLDCTDENQKVRNAHMQFLQELCTSFICITMYSLQDMWLRLSKLSSSWKSWIHALKLKMVQIQLRICLWRFSWFPFLIILFFSLFGQKEKIKRFSHIHFNNDDPKIWNVPVASL